MPKLYEYLGIVIFFYSNEHEPVHVHGRYQRLESRATIIIVEGRIVRVEIGDVGGKRPLEGEKLKDFREFVEARAEEIVERWVAFFVRNERITPQIITRRIR